MRFCFVCGFHNERCCRVAGFASGVVLYVCSRSLNIFSISCFVLFMRHVWICVFLQHQHQVAQAVERSKHVSMAELNAIIGVSLFTFLSSNQSINHQCRFQSEQWHAGKHQPQKHYSELSLSLSDYSSLKLGPIQLVLDISHFTKRTKSDIKW